jgi:hypothetical protein
MAVRLPDATDRISCAFTPPGLRRGLALAAAAALVTVGLALTGAVRRRLSRRTAVS